jgi:hypothetical protein
MSNVSPAARAAAIRSANLANWSGELKITLSDSRRISGRSSRL